MKRFLITVLIALIFPIALNGCAFLDNQENFKVTVILSDSSENYDTTEKSLMSSIEELGYENKIEFKTKNAKGDLKKLNRYIKNLSSDTDLVVTVGTEAAIAAKEAKLLMPVVFINVPCPDENEVATSLEATDNITGIACDVPVENVFELAYTIDQNIDSVGLIYDPIDNNSTVYIDKSIEICKLVGIDYYTLQIDKNDDIAEQAKELITKTDMLFAPYSKASFELMTDLSKLSKMYGTPIYTNNMDMVKSGALASIEVNYTALGHQTAHMIVRILGGVDVKNTPVENAKEYITSINTDIAEGLDIDIPDSLENEYIPVSFD